MLEEMGMKVGKIIDQSEKCEKVWVAFNPWEDYAVIGIYKGTLSEEDVRRLIADEMNEKLEDGINELVEGARLQKWVVQE